MLIDIYNKNITHIIIPYLNLKTRFFTQTKKIFENITSLYYNENEYTYIVLESAYGKFKKSSDKVLKFNNFSKEKLKRKTRIQNYKLYLKYLMFEKFPFKYHPLFYNHDENGTFFIEHDIEKEKEKNTLIYLFNYNEKLFYKIMFEVYKTIVIRVCENCFVVLRTF